MPNEQRRLKILFLPSRSWYPSEDKPGAGVFVKQHAKAVALYHDVVVLYAYFGENRSLRQPFRLSDQLEDGIRTIRVACQWRIPLSNFLLYYWTTFIQFRKLLKEGWRPDIIHAHVFPAGLPAWLLSRLYKIPFVITEHWTGFVRKKLTIFERAKVRFVMSRASMIIPVSVHLKQHLEAYGIKGRFQVIPNMIDTNMFYYSPSTTEIKDKKHILSVTSLVSKKGMPNLLRAIRQVKEKRQDFHLDIVGDGPNRSEYEGLASSLGLNGLVEFRGRQPEVASFMRSCDFFVQASLFETFGIVYIEAMACGKPVIASNIGGPNEIIPPDSGILVSPNDIKALAKAIEHMLDNYSLYSADKISQYAKENFSYESVGKQISEAYLSVLSIRHEL
jgi:glycosyltransferase involved in cell wall biosynthesis